MSKQYVTRGDKLRTIIGFGLIGTSGCPHIKVSNCASQQHRSDRRPAGFANTILPSLIFSAAYLIIPYPRPIVVLIQTLPAVATKLLLPHLLYNYVDYWKRPVVLAGGWVITAIVACFTPPNVTPQLRVLTVVLASVISAGGDICWLGLVRYYGKHGLSGWGLGTGAGGIACAVLPYVLTVSMGTVLRSGILYAYYLAPLILLSHWFIIPAAPTPKFSNSWASAKGDDDSDPDSSAQLLIQDAPTNSMSAWQRVDCNLRLVSKAASPFILPLLLSSTCQFIIYPGISRAMAITPVFDRYSTYLGSYGFSFQLGNCIARSSLLVDCHYRRKWSLMVMGFSTALVLLNAGFVFEAAPIPIFLAVFVIGVTTGLVYIETFSTALEDRAYLSAKDKEFSLQLIGIGEHGGLLLGGLIGNLLEINMCGMMLGTGDRWCHTTK